MTTDCLVVGGGIAGLSCAWTLHRAGRDVLLLEAEARAGGNLRTQRRHGFTYETGPHTIMAGADAIWTLVAELDAEDIVEPARPSSRARFIWREGRLHRLPGGPLSFLTTKVLSLRGKMRLAAEPFIPGRASENDTAAAFFTRRLGEEALNWLVGPFISGVYAGDPSRLGARDGFRKMWSWEKEAGSMTLGARRYMKAKRRERAGRPTRKGLFSFRRGLGMLCERLAAALGDAVVAGRAARSVARRDGRWLVATDDGSYVARQLVVAVPPGEAGRLFAADFPQLAATLDAVEMAPVAVVHLGVNAEAAAAVPDGFGFLVPRGQGLDVLGCLFPSKMFAGRAPHGCELLSCYVGGVFSPAAVELSDGDLIGIVKKDLGVVLGCDPSPCFAEVLRHPAAIPQLTLGHADRMIELNRRVRALGGLALAGNYLTGVGVNDAAQSGRAAAASLLEELHAS